MKIVSRMGCQITFNCLKDVIILDTPGLAAKLSTPFVSYEGCKSFPFLVRSMLLQCYKNCGVKNSLLMNSRTKEQLPFVFKFKIDLFVGATRCVSKSTLYN